MRKTVTQRTRQSLSHTVDTWRNHANIQKRFLLLGTKIVKRWRNQVMTLAIYTHVYIHTQVICVDIYSLSVGHWLRLGWLQVMGETVEHCRSSLRIFSLVGHSFMCVLVSSWSQLVVVSRSFGASLRDGMGTPGIKKNSGGLPTKCGGGGRTCLLLVRLPYTVTTQSRRRGIELSVVGSCATGHTGVLQRYLTRGSRCSLIIIL